MSSMTPRKLRRHIMHGSIDGVARGLANNNPKLRDDLAAATGAGLIGTAFGPLSAALAQLFAVLNNPGRIINFLDVVPPGQVAAIRNGTSTFDCAPVLEQLIANNTAVLDPAAPWRKRGPSIYFPAGLYRFNKTVAFNAQVNLLGTHTGIAANVSNGQVATFYTPGSNHGFIFHSFMTSGDDYENLVVHPNIMLSPGQASGSLIHGIKFVGGGNTIGKYHGIIQKCQLAIVHCEFDLWGGYGILNYNDLETSDPKLLGNSNVSLYYALRGIRCGDGLIMSRGSDANASLMMHLEASSNGGYGIEDRSFLGNTYIGGHTADNGTPYAGGNVGWNNGIYCSFGGNRYRSFPGATEAQLVAVQPGTDPTVWALFSTGGPDATFPLWTAGLPVGTFKAVNMNVQGSMVAYNGRHYAANPGPLGPPTYLPQTTLNDLVTTVPGTNPDVWVDLGANPYLNIAVLNWVPGRPAGTYRFGGGLRMQGLNAESVVLGMYHEGDQAPNYLWQPRTIVQGGVNSKNYHGPTPVVRALNNQVYVPTIHTGYDTVADITLSFQDSFFVMESGQANEPWRLKRTTNSDLLFDHANLGARIAYRITGPQTTTAFGRSQPVPYVMSFPRIALGDTNGRIISYGPFVNGEVVARGEIRLRLDPSAGGKIGWVCTTGGIVGSTAVIKEWGAIDV